MSRLPAASNSTTLPWRATMVTTPGQRPLSTSAFMPAGKRARRSVDMPTLSALAVGKSCGAASAGETARAGQRGYGK